MSVSALLVLGFAVCKIWCLPPQIYDITKENMGRIDKINKGLKLREGDILVSSKRSSILNKWYRWNTSVPYVFEEDLEMNAKGVILRAFEQFRLKSCIDFKPRKTEDYYITVLKREGCFSNIGKSVKHGQPLSIGYGCDDISTVEHEFLHALGFFHEQSRYDRDDHVRIVWKNILPGMGSNFLKTNNKITSNLGTPYDYNSVMHYDKDAFSNGNGSTIITIRPELQDVIGKSTEMSTYDVLELNKLYGCNAAISFLDQCSFANESLCQMSHCFSGGSGWERVTTTAGGPYSDHTYLETSTSSSGKSDPSTPAEGSAFFMHLSTERGEEGDSAWLETRVMRPSRPCHVQCLQFFYYHSGGESDQLNIWIREYDNEHDTRGTLRLMDQITGPPAHHWQLRHVPLKADRTFQVEFEARKGAGKSSGGFSVDDINLSETECPHNTWHIRNFEKLLKTSKYGTSLYSPRYYSRDGYGYQALVQLYKSYFGVFLRLVSGDYDDKLQWPCTWRQLTAVLLDQNAHIQQRMSKQFSLTTDPKDKTFTGLPSWDNPRLIGTQFKDENNEVIYVNPAYGIRYFMTFDDLRKRDLLKGGDIFLQFSMDDISVLLQNDSLPCPAVPLQSFKLSPDQLAEKGPCASRATVTTTEVPQTTTSSRTTTTTTEALETTTSTKALTTATEGPQTTTSSLCESIFCNFCPNVVSSPLTVLLALLIVLAQ